jgi:hypothetical protein
MARKGTSLGKRRMKRKNGPPAGDEVQQMCFKVPESFSGGPLVAVHLPYPSQTLFFVATARSTFNFQTFSIKKGGHASFSVSSVIWANRYLPPN